VVKLPAPKTESVVLPVGTLKVACVAHVQVPAGMLTVVVDIVTALNAAWTSELLQLAAVMVCECARKTTLSKSINIDVHLMAMGGGGTVLSISILGLDTEQELSKLCVH
jgi:hypothetical protein